MPLACLTSPKGGVGRTTLAATLGIGLHRLGWQVLAVDLDGQNALQLNFALPDDIRGIAGALDGDRGWDELVVETPAGIGLIPFGAASARELLRVQAQVAQDPDWLRARLTPFSRRPDLVVLVDMPAAPSVVNLAIDPIADLHLSVLLADAMSLALLPKIQRGDYLLAAGDRLPQLGYVLNQVDPRRQLCRDVLALGRDILGEALYGIVHRDEAVAEAAACQQTVLDYAPESVASQDVMAIARRVHAGLAHA